ncbi:MAG: hypothetical protein IJD67_04275 [Clostridia bacterium]|nr:hypothetical protein [Clostridia bacterium]
MKTELEFISGVYEKYQKEQEIRRKRVRTLSLCATLSACACVAVVISIRTVPILLDGGAKTAEDAAYTHTYTAASVSADRAIEYELYDAELAVEEAAEEEAYEASMAPKATASGSEREAQNGDAKIIVKSARPKNKADDSLFAAAVSDRLVCTAGINGDFSYKLPEELAEDAVATGVNCAIDCEIISENVSGSGAVYGECDKGYYVSFSADDTLFLLIKDTEAIASDELKAIAESITYNVK